MKLKERIDAVSGLSKALIDLDQTRLKSVFLRAEQENKWFSQDNIKQSVIAIRDQFCDFEKIKSWTELYHIPSETKPLRVGLILAGNIPLVGFHDVLSCFMAGHHCKIKLSDKDKLLIPMLISELERIDARTADYFSFVDKLTDYDAVIATGSNNSAVHFAYYFKNHKHIIRRNRNAIAIITGDESREDIIALGSDIFDYFGLGCRNVSKLYVPAGYNFDFMLGILHDEFKELANHNKYKNNYDYNYAIFLLDKEDFLASGSLILRESTAIASRIASVYYEYYENIPSLLEVIAEKESEIQCVISKLDLPDLNSFALGHAQRPGLTDYADGIDTMEFLLSL